MEKLKAGNFIQIKIDDEQEDNRHNMDEKSQRGLVIFIAIFSLIGVFSLLDIVITIFW